MRTATSKLARTSWGLDTAPETETHWSKRGLCVRNPDMWSYSGTGRSAHALLGRARHLCLNHCPVLAECTAMAESHPPKDFAGTITAGQYYTAHQGRGAKVSATPPADPGHGHWCPMGEADGG